MMSGGDEGVSLAAPEYVEVKTSVWWDIENCPVPKKCDPFAIAQNIRSALNKMNYRGAVSIASFGDTNGIPHSVQEALSSTGIKLNHVPAGVKDASDKKILVDMLFWAVDNPAPANFLLISGDRDFSNALHQLRMRRYNILLAHPPNVSQPLRAAAKTLWLWTNLVGGGPPLANGESPQFVSSSNGSNIDIFKNSISEAMPISQQSMDSIAGKSTDIKNKGKKTRETTSQPNTSWTSSAPIGMQESESNGSSQKLGYYDQAKHELFCANKSSYFPSSPESSWNNGSNFPINYPHQYPQPMRPSNAHSQPNFPHVLQPNSHPHGPGPLPPRPDVSSFNSVSPLNVTYIFRPSVTKYPKASIQKCKRENAPGKPSAARAKAVTINTSKGKAVAAKAGTTSAPTKAKEAEDPKASIPKCKRGNASGKPSAARGKAVTIKTSKVSAPTKAKRAAGNRVSKPSKSPSNTSKKG